MAIFNSYLSLPEGKQKWSSLKIHERSLKIIPSPMLKFIKDHPIWSGSKATCSQGTSSRYCTWVSAPAVGMLSFWRHGWQALYPFPVTNNYKSEQKNNWNHSETIWCGYPEQGKHGMELALQPITWPSLGGTACGINLVAGTRTNYHHHNKPLSQRRRNKNNEQKQSQSVYLWCISMGYLLNMSLHFWWLRIQVFTTAWPSWLCGPDTTRLPEQRS